jgi:phosphopantetheine adenylyltransferase
MPEKAMYVLSGDPLTNSHTDIVKRAKETFGSLRVAQAINPGKVTGI